MNKLVNYIKASWDELFRVVWPTRAQAIRLTLVVIGFSAVLAIYISLLDGVFRSALQHFFLKG